LSAAASIDGRGRRMWTPNGHSRFPNTGKGGGPPLNEGGEKRSQNTTRGKIEPLSTENPIPYEKHRASNPIF